MSEDGPERLGAETDLDTVCEHDIALIYKHSPRCGVSLATVGEVRRFMEANAGVPVYVVDVIRDRPVSRAVERRLGVRHESPQVLLLQRGVAVWNASHRAVTAEALAREVEAVRSPGSAIE